MRQFKKEDSRLIFEYILDTAPKDMIMLDVGARTGKWVVPFVQEFPSAQFFCFEALPNHYERLKNRFRKFNNVVTHNAVISNKKELITFYQDLDRAGWSGLRKHQYLKNFKELILESSILDEYNIEPYFMKIDVEGAELLALEGAVNTLKTTKVIYFECNEIHFKEYNYSSNDLYEFLMTHNFTLSTITFEELNKEKFSYLTADERRYETNRQSNFIAIKKDV